MLKFFKSLFKKSAAQTEEIPPMPSWKETVEIMYDMSLDALKEIKAEPYYKKYFI